jgi:hypothetical protein
MLKTAKRRFPRRVNGGTKPNILQPHSGAEIWRENGSHGCDFWGLAEQPPMRARSVHGEARNGNGEPPPDQPVQVLCEDHSGTYQLPFACRWVDGEWRNSESGGTVEATVVGWRLPRQ